MRIKALLSYKGTNYFGYQKQVDKVTVQGVIEEKLSQVLNGEVSIYASGRTDAGVHASGQVFHFDVDKEIDLGKLRYSLNKMLPNDIHIISLEYVDEDFHARFSLKDKNYIYKIIFKEKLPFEDELVYCCPFPTDVELFEKALMKFVGKHNFMDFTSKEEDEDMFVREITDISFSNEGEVLLISITGDGFMRYMIRMMVGTALAIAMGKEKLDYIDEHLDSKKERNVVSYKAPAQGLYLNRVEY